MTRIAVIIGSASSASASGAPTLPMSDRGAVALAMARFGGDVRAYAADAGARCFARAAGVEAVEEISGPETAEANSAPETVAAILDPEVGAIEFALIGRGGCGEPGDLLPARLAEESGAALVYDVIDVQREADRLVVTRDLGRGARDLLSVRGRAVLVVADSVGRGLYVSRYRINAEGAANGESAARKQPSGAEWERATPRVRLGDHASRVAGRAVERMNALFGVGEIAQNTASLVRGSAEECARQLFRYLSHHGFVERGLGGEPPSASEGAVASQLTERRPQRSAADAASIPIRARRRPRLLSRRPLAARGPFEVGVDV